MKKTIKSYAILIIVMLFVCKITVLDFINSYKALAGSADTSAISFSVDLTWPSVTDATDYKIYRDSTIIGETQTNTYNDTAIVEDAVYEYVIKSYNSSGNELASTNPKRISTYDYQEPVVPTNISGTAIDATSISVSWSAAGNTSFNTPVSLSWIPKKQNLAFGKPYVKSEEPVYSYPDSNIESTDGVLAYEYYDGKSYGYIVNQDETKSVDVIINLKQKMEVNDVKIHKWEGSNLYGADSYQVYASEDGVNFNLVSSSYQTDGIWFDFSFSNIEAQYIKVVFNKHNDGTYGKDWLFIDEIQVYNNETINTSDSNDINLAANQTYVKSEEPVAYYSDSGMESTDGILAKDYSDGYSYGYPILENTTKSVDITMDLKSITAINNVRVHKWEGSFHYEADNVNIFISQDGVNYEFIGSLNETIDKWRELTFSTTNTRYIRFNFVKTNDGSSGSDWLFIDELQVYCMKSVMKEVTPTYEVEEDGNVINNGPSTTYVKNNLSPDSQISYRIRERVGSLVSDWSSPITINLPSLVSPSPTVTDTPVPDVTPKPEPNPTDTPVPEVTPISTPTVTDTPVPEVTPIPTTAVTDTPVPEVTPIPTPIVTDTPVPEVTPIPTPTVTDTPVPHVTLIPTPEMSSTPIPEKTPVPTKVPVSSPYVPVNPKVTQIPTGDTDSVGIPEPNTRPTSEPNTRPTLEPNTRPTPEPSKKPIPEPTPESTIEQTSEPTKSPHTLINSETTIFPNINETNTTNETEDLKPIPTLGHDTISESTGGSHNESELKDNVKGITNDNIEGSVIHTPEPQVTNSGNVNVDDNQMNLDSGKKVIKKDRDNQYKGMVTLLFIVVFTSGGTGYYRYNKRKYLLKDKKINNKNKKKK